MKTLANIADAGGRGSIRNMLALTSLRGYSAAGMDLVLPTDEERDANELPADTPTRGSHGPATVHGTVAGEIYHQLTKESTHG